MKRLTLLLWMLMSTMFLAPVLVAIAVFDWVIAAGTLPFVTIMPLLLLGPVTVLALYQARRYRLKRSIAFNQGAPASRQDGAKLVFTGGSFLHHATSYGSR